MAIIETVKIVSAQSKTGYIIINKEDFTNRHEIFKEAKEEKEAKEKPEVQEKPKRKKEGSKNE